jgi:topoisomerase IA-like protein
VKKTIDINLEVLKSGGYSIEELIEIKNPILGEYEGTPVYLKTGKYGSYVECGEKRESIKSMNKPLDEIMLDDMIPLLRKDEKQDKNILRKINDEMSVRRGKFGNYVFYKTEKMKKPEFFNIKKFPECPITCELDVFVEWLNENYVNKSK